MSKFRLVGIVAACILQGGYMLFDGIHKLLTHRYFGNQLGPWAGLVSAVGIDPESLAPIFVLLGCLWLSAPIAVLLRVRWSRPLLTVVALVSLAYLPFGTILSVLVLALLFSAGQHQRVNPQSGR